MTSEFFYVKSRRVFTYLHYPKQHFLCSFSYLPGIKPIIPRMKLPLKCLKERLQKSLLPTSTFRLKILFSDDRQACNALLYYLICNYCMLQQCCVVLYTFTNILCIKGGRFHLNENIISIQVHFNSLHFTPNLTCEVNNLTFKSDFGLAPTSADFVLLLFLLICSNLLELVEERFEGIELPSGSLRVKGFG